METHTIIEKIFKTRKHVCRCAFFLLLLIFAFRTVSGQYSGVPVVETPKSATFQPNVIINNSSVKPPSYNFYNPRSIQEQNARQMQEVQQQQRQINQMQVQGTINELEPRGINIAVCKSVIPLPDFTSEPETECFHNALSEMGRMLTGEIPISLKDAVFMSENAYFGNRMSYKDYNDKIKETAGFCRAKIRQQGLNPNDNEVLCMTLFHYMTDTFKLKLSGSERTLIHYPIKYDFEDYDGRENISNVFVTKLMAKNSGQCHNMPQFYLIVAEELGAKVHLSTSPKHSFIKFQDNDGYWNNIELTCGAIFNDQHYLGSGFIKAEALRNKIYLEPLTRQQTIAEVTVDLACNYIRKYGYDGFVQQCVDMALKYNPNSSRACMVQANLNTVRAMYVIERAGMPPVERLAECPQAYRLYQKMHQSYKTLEDIGYEEMPNDAYQGWLDNMNKEKMKPEYQQNNKLHRIIQ